MLDVYNSTAAQPCLLYNCISSPAALVVQPQTVQLHQLYNHITYTAVSVIPLYNSYTTTAVQLHTMHPSLSKRLGPSLFKDLTWGAFMVARH